ncbi:MAG: preprotein translocase subunit SecY [bacterium]
MNFLTSIFSIPELKKRISYVFIIIALYRLGGFVPISGVDIDAIQALFSQNGILGFFNLFSGGGLSRFSIFALGILPYINASIIMQLVTVIWPKIKELAEEGDSGRKQISQYTRYLAIALSFVQSIVMTLGFSQFVKPEINFGFFMVYSVLGLVAGAAIVMWLGELITENGIGNGASVLIFIGIISELPLYIKNTVILVQGGTSILQVLLLVGVFLAMIVSIVYVQEAERKIPVQYARKVVGRKMYGAQNTFIPFRLIQGGVMPIIFASALLQFPLMFFQYVKVPMIQDFFSEYYRYDGVVYNLLFCILIFFFTYFYTAITFNPKDLSENIKKHGGFIMGIRPGKSTELHLERIITKLTLFGAVFLSLFALVPVIAANLTKVTSFMGIGGTALLIIVGVAIDLVRQIETYLISKRYEGMI